MTELVKFTQETVFELFYFDRSGEGRNQSGNAYGLMNAILYAKRSITERMEFQLRYNGSVVAYGLAVEMALRGILCEDMHEPTFTVYQTRRQYDMNEGRGMMVNDLCFGNRALAEAYIDVQPGVQGRKQKWSTVKSGQGDWDIIEVVVNRQMVTKEDKEREAALKKLTQKEKKLLGLIP